jgi:hypothetical protein
MCSVPSLTCKHEARRAQKDAAYRDSTVPTVTEGRKGVKRKKLRGEITVTSILVVSMF